MIGAGLQAAGSIFGGIAASRAAKRARERVEAGQKKNRDWYTRRYNEDATQRADAQAVLTRTEESIRDRNRAAAGTQAVVGGTEEGVAAAKAANNEAIAQATAAIAANGAARKDAIEEQYRQADAGYEQQLFDIEQQKAANISQAVQGVAQAGANIAGLF